MTLVFIMIFSLLILTMMQKLMFSSQIYEKIRTQHRAFYDLDTVAEHLFQHIFALKDRCTIPENDLSSVEESWLKEKGCELILSDNKYHYLFADIGEFPCLEITTTENKMGSHHWWIIISSENMRHTVLWMRVATPEKRLICYQKSLAQPIESRLSWQVLND